MKLRIFLLLFLIPISFSITQAQVTIGSEINPNAGAMLDLKQYAPGSDNTTATKGLGLPRVNLTTPNALSDIADAVGFEVEHTGLVVYSLNKCLNKTGRDNGVYVWTGSEWQALNAKIVRSSDVYELSDTRAGITETYTYSRFGDAGIWMTENMRATHYADGTIINLHDGGNQYATPAYAYPSSTIDGWNTPSTSYDQNPKQGLLYNWAAATNNYNTVKSRTNQGQNAGTSPSGNEVETDNNLAIQDYRNYYVVQGICPDGWHVPSDREWNELEKEIYENADKYSTYTNAEVVGWNSSDPWLATWESDDANWRGSNTSVGHGFAMQHSCFLMNTSYSGGTSKLSEEGGFSILLTGSVNTSSMGAYGTSSFIWSSSGGSNDNIGYTRQWNRGQVKVSRDRTYRRNLHSVRCKKNDLNP